MYSLSTTWNLSNWEKRSRLTRGPLEVLCTEMWPCLWGDHVTQNSFLLSPTFCKQHVYHSLDAALSWRFPGRCSILEKFRRNKGKSRSGLTQGIGVDFEQNLRSGSWGAIHPSRMCFIGNVLKQLLSRKCKSELWESWLTPNQATY